MAPAAPAPARFLSAPWVLPIVTPPLHDGAVVVDATDTILAVGPRAELRQRHPTLPEERATGALLPGLVNAHTHLELSALAGQIPSAGGFVAWASALAQKLAPLTAEQTLTAATIAAHDARATGTAAVGDVCNTLNAVAALGRAGLRGMIFHELVGSREARTGDAIKDAAAERARWLQDTPWPEGVGYTVAPHAAFSVGPDLFRRIFAATAQHHRPTSVHVAEGPDELALLQNGTGRWPPILDSLGVPPGSRTPRLTPVAYLASLGAFAGPHPPLLVHMVHATAADRQLARQHGATIVLCPRSNLHIGDALPDVRAIIDAGTPIAVGTDSLASSPSLSLWDELSTLLRHFPDLSPALWLRAATLGGARALEMPLMGALAAGMRPGIIDVGIVDAAADDPIRALLTNPAPSVRWMAQP